MSRGKEQEDFSLKETSPNIGGGRVSGCQKLSTSFDLVEPMPFLYIRILRARGLPENSDPFAEVKVGNCKGSTKHFEETSTPEWNHVFAFTKERIQGITAEIVVRDKKMGEDDIIGKLTFDIFDIPTRVPPDSPLAPQWYSLEDKNGIKGEKGEMMMTIWMGTQADEVFPDAWHSDVASVSGESSISCTRSKVYLSPRLWYLRINIIQAQDLVIRDKNRKPEAFVKAIVGNVGMRSRISRCKNMNPIWNEDMMFVVAEPFDAPLILSVEDRQGDKMEETLGRCVIPLSKVEKRFQSITPTANWYNLEKVAVEEDEQDDVKYASRLHLRISLDGGYHVIDESIYYSSDFRATSKLLWTPTIGVLELGILNATCLLPVKSTKEKRGTTDAYCVAKYGPKWVRTRTIVDSLAPKWNEQYTWEVYDPNTVITIGVFDNTQLEGPDKAKGIADPRIGKVRIRLSTLETDRIYTHSYPLIALQSKGVKKMGEIQLAVRFTCSSTWNLLQSYTRPLFPSMHYVQPLSVYQVESLRHQATHILSSRLGRAEPSLKKEVVEYMLDVGTNIWSLRRGRAHSERILATLNGFVKAWEWFDQMRKWKRPHFTAFIHLVYLILVLAPFNILHLVFFFCFLKGIWEFKNRPRHPPHMDTKLSLADSTNSDELDEEFDTFPTSKSGDVLKNRYDRLRKVAGRMMIVLGDLATQMERFQSLLSWRDPRATSMFVIFCLFGGIALSAIPRRLLVIGVGFFAMRHPRFRNNIPSLPQNFFRRLPSRADTML